MRAKGSVCDPDAGARIPRWRGFNLQGKFALPQRPYAGPVFDEFDFATVKEWGFDFARLPVNYWAWGSREDWTKIREEPLKEIDRAVDWGREYGIHIHLNFHRFPAIALTVASWNRRISFQAELPSVIGRLKRRFITGRPSRSAIREFETMNPPTWPLKDDRREMWDRERLKREYVEKYRPLTDRKVAIHVGEWGCFNKTPHPVTLAWMSDCLSLWKEAGWGFALWNLRGSFGVLDSQRPDV